MSLGFLSHNVSHYTGSCIRRQTAQLSLLCIFALSQGPHISYQYIAVWISLLPYLALWHQIERFSNSPPLGPSKNTQYRVSTTVTATQNMTYGLNKLQWASLHYMTKYLVTQRDYTLKRMNKLTSFLSGYWNKKERLLTKGALCLINQNRLNFYSLSSA